MIFDFNEHKHRFAVWTAARSVQRSFTNNKNIKEAINFTSIKSFSESNEIISSDQFDELQKEWCKAIIKSLEEKKYFLFIWTCFKNYYYLFKNFSYFT